MEKEVCSVTGKRMYSRKEADNLKTQLQKKVMLKKEYLCDLIIVHIVVITILRILKII